ncbi:MAG: type II secretion system F family protein [Nocardioides sp.]
MSVTIWGAFLGLGFGTGLLVFLRRLRLIGKPQLATRVLPYVRDLPEVGRTPALRVVSPSPVTAARGVFGPVLGSGARLVERTLGGSLSVGRRLQRAGIAKTVHEFRIEQVIWGVLGFAVAAAWSLLRTLTNPGSLVAGLLLCGVGFMVGVMARDSYLTSQATRREREIVHEFPVIAELLALAVAAGESPVAALGRVVERSGGELSKDLAQVLGQIRTGEPVGAAFEELARNTGLPVVARFAQGVAVAMERGTPLADVLHAQAGDVREAGRRDLIETAARKEVLMMVPVVVLVLPVTVLFAFFPGALALNVGF